MRTRTSFLAAATLAAAFFASCQKDALDLADNGDAAGTTIPTPAGGGGRIQVSGRP